MAGDKSLFALTGKNIVTPDGIREAALVIADGKIRDVVSIEAVPAGMRVEDAGDWFVLPGLVDTHVHVNAPGRTEWEGFATATRAAAAGGITTLVDMPLNSTPVTTTLAALEAKRAEASSRCWVDVGFHGGLIPGSEDTIEALLDAGVMGIKAFLVHSGIDDFPNATEKELRAVMPLLARRSVPLLVHAELSGDAPAMANPRRYADYLASRPPEWEERAIGGMLELCAEYGCPVHVVHLATAGALPMLARARAGGLPVTVETCPHYLTFHADEIADGHTQFKCAPPIRDEANRQGLWDGLRAGIIDLIVSDHSPCPPEMKRLETGDFGAAWGGISSLQLGLSAVWTEARKQGFDLADVARWMSSQPARLAGLSGMKGTLTPGADADFVLFDPNATFTVTPETLHHRHKLTPYEGRTLQGVVRAAYLRGQRIYDGKAFAANPTGTLRQRKQEAMSETQMALAELNGLSVEEANAAFFRCCGVAQWAEQMAARRPFAHPDALRDAAEALWPEFTREAWLEAFSHHPQIGDVDSLRAKFAATRTWAAGEQAGVQEASEETLRALAEGNRAYEAKFGYIFIVCATGKSAAEMLALLRARLPNDPDVELPLAAEEQKRITRLRLEKLLSA